MNNLKGMKIILNGYSLIITVIAVLSMALNIFLFADLINQSSTKTLPEDVSNEDLVSHLRTYVSLPAETPTIGTIDNIDDLIKKNPVFYQDAKTGDKLIIFSTKGIIYRISEDKIINMVNINSNLQITPTPAN